VRAAPPAPQLPRRLVRRCRPPRTKHRPRLHLHLPTRPPTHRRKPRHQRPCKRQSRPTHARARQRRNDARHIRRPLRQRPGLRRAGAQPRATPGARSPCRRVRTPDPPVTADPGPATVNSFVDASADRRCPHPSRRRLPKLAQNSGPARARGLSADPVEDACARDHLHQPARERIGSSTASAAQAAASAILLLLIPNSRRKVTQVAAESRWARAATIARR
jgi:hypothetical protein